VDVEGCGRLSVQVGWFVGEGVDVRASALGDRRVGVEVV
jgi:hypothetical protein